MNITCQGRPYLEAPLGCDHFCAEFVRGKVAQWEDELSLLAHIAITQPHAAFVAFTHGMVHRFTYVRDRDGGLTRIAATITQRAVKPSCHLT